MEKRPQSASPTLGETWLNWPQVAGGIIVAALVILALAIFYQSLRWIYRLLAWLLSLPRIATEERNLARFVVALVALLFASPVISYMISVIAAGLGVLPRAIDELFRAARLVAARCTYDCSIDILQFFGTALAGFVNALVSALRLDTFPVGSFLTFLVVYALLFSAHTSFRAWRQRRRADDGAQVLPGPGVTQIGFFGIVVFAFYLSLSALLVLSLMQSATAPQGFTEKELKSAIDLEIPADEAFLDRFGALATFPSELAEDARLSPARSEVAHQLHESAMSLTADWATAAKSTHLQLIDLQSRAVENFASQSAERLGGRPTIDHFDRMLEWFQQRRWEREANLSACARAVNAWIRTAVELVENWRLAPHTDSAVEQATPDDPAYTIAQQMQGDLRNTLGSCDAAQGQRYELVPERPSRGESLGYVGKMTGWLLDTDSSPLVIIIGLVGFSLLGATVSRVVRLGASDGLAGLEISDLLRVVAGGVTAAMLVFLAAYGGLAVLGETEANPNPYVIFSFCLVGAIFSERVWLWAEDSILARLTGRKRDGAAPAPDPEPKCRQGPECHPAPADDSRPAGETPEEDAAADRAPPAEDDVPPPQKPAEDF